MVVQTDGVPRDDVVAGRIEGYAIIVVLDVVTRDGIVV